MTNSRQIGRFAAFAALATAVLGTGGRAAACDTPVYRYALARWEPAPFRVFYLFREQVPKADAAVLERIDAAINPAATQTATTNLRLQRIDAAKADQMEALPEDVRTRWAEKLRREESVYLVFTSWGAELHAGKLSVDDVAALVQSPVRRAIAQRIEEDNTAVLLVLSGKDAADTKAAEALAAEVTRQVAAGKIRLGSAAESEEPIEGPDKSPAGAKAKPPADGGKESVPAKPQASPPTGADAPLAPPPPKPVRLATVLLSRGDPAEAWLVRALTAAEKDFPEFAGRAMVFPVFGRGRVLAPCADKTLTVEALARKLDLLASACSCTVKDQNPGVDLLFSWDWDAAADKVASKDATLSGVASTDAFPLDAGKAPPPGKPSPAAAPSTASPPAAPVAAPPAAKAAVEPNAPTPSPTAAPPAGETAAPTPAAALTETSAPASDPPQVVAGGTWLLWAAALAIGCGAIVAVGFLTRRSAG